MHLRIELQLIIKTVEKKLHFNNIFFNKNASF